LDNVLKLVTGQNSDDLDELLKQLQ
jgi:hypothetical protein